MDHLCIVTDHKNRDANLLDEAADNEKVNIVADAVMSRTRENDFKETFDTFTTQFPSCETIPNSLNAKFRKQQTKRSQRFESASDKPLNQSRQCA